MVRGFCVGLLVFACSAPAAEARVSVRSVKDPVREVQAGERLRVAFTVRNSARTRAKATRARVALVRGRTVRTLKNRRVPRIAARKSKALAVNAVAPASAGRYRVRVCVAAKCRQSRRSVTVTVPPLPAPLPAPALPPTDTTPPGAPKLVAGEFATVTGGTLFYRAGGNRTFTVNAAADADVTRVEFASLGPGWPGGGSDTTTPSSARYQFSALPAPAGPLTAVAFDAAGNASPAARLQVAGDGAAPQLTLTCEPDDCTGEVSLRATDALSGVAAILYSIDGSEPATPYTKPFLATTEMPLRVRAVDRVGNVSSELARTVGPPPTQFAFTFGEERVNAYGDDDSQTAWLRPGVAGSLRVTAGDVADVEWPQLGAGWTVEPDLDSALYSFTAAAAPPLIVAVEAENGARRSFFRLRHDGTPPTAPAIACACEAPSTVGVEITLTAADGDSGLDRILYSLDGSDPSRPYAGPFTAYTSGTLRTRAVDRVGNAGPIAARTLDIDVSGDPTDPSAPVLRFTPLSGTDERGGTVYFTPGAPQSFLLVATAEDEQSGIASITYPDLPGWTRTTAQNGAVYDRGPSPDESGPHTVRATNHAGRTSETAFNVVREPA